MVLNIHAKKNKKKTAATEDSAIFVHFNSNSSYPVTRCNPQALNTEVMWPCTVTVKWKCDVHRTQDVSMNYELSVTVVVAMFLLKAAYGKIPVHWP